MVDRTQEPWQHISFCWFDDDHVLNTNTKRTILIVPGFCVFMGGRERRRGRGRRGGRGRGRGHVNIFSL